jgi:hypothetical protein
VARHIKFHRSKEDPQYYADIPLAQPQRKTCVPHLRSRSRPTTLVALVMKRPGGLFLRDNSAQTARNRKLAATKTWSMSVPRDLFPSI